MALTGGGIAAAGRNVMPPPGMAPPMDGAEISIPGLSQADSAVPGAMVTSHPDGSSTVEFGDENDGQLPPGLAWDANLAEHLDESTLARISNRLLEEINDDIQSMQQWLEDYLAACAALGIRYEERSFPFPKATGATATLLLKAVLRGQATASGEMLPAAGPVKVATYGSDSPAKPPAQPGQPSTTVEAKAERKKNFYNWLFTAGDKEFRDDFDQMLLLLFIAGTIIRKVYRDPKTKRVTSRFLPPQNTIISYTAAGLNSCGRITHRILMEGSELIRMQLAKEYRWFDDPLGKPDNTQTPQQKKLDALEGRKAVFAQEDREYEVFETVCDLDIDHPDLQHMQKLEGDDEAEAEPSGMAMPYIISIETQTRKVLALRRNWKQNDPLYQRKTRFVAYHLIPGLGFWGFGYGHLVGGMQKAATQMLRQFIDGTTLAMFPGGVTIAKSVRPEQNRMPIGPSEFREIDTGGKPLNQAFAALPFREPPAAAVQALEFITKAGEDIGNVAEMQVGDGQANMPVGTVVALLNVQTQVQSAILKRSYHSFANELAIYEELLGEDKVAKYPYEVEGNPAFIMATDFDGRPDVVPVADPNIPTQTARIMQASAVEMLADKSPPGLFDPREVRVQLLETLGKTPAQIDKLMPPPPTAFSGDVMSEIMLAMQSKPIRSTPMQDHLSHIKAKLAALQAPGVVQMPAAQILMSNIAEHYAFLFHDQVQVALGEQAKAQGQQPPQLPPPGQPMPPQIEAQISGMVASVMHQVVQQLQSMAGASGDQSAAMEQQIRLAEIHQKEADSQRKTGGAIVQNRTELVKTQATTADNAAQRQADLELARINLQISDNELEKARILAQSNLERAHAGIATTVVKTSADHAKTEADREKTAATLEVAAHSTEQAKESTKQAELGVEAAKAKPSPTANGAKK